VLEFNTGSHFREHIEHVWSHLKEVTRIKVNKSCGVHVHLSPNDNIGVWTLPAVKAICRSIVYFEFAIEALLPSTRRCNHWTKSNVYDNDHFPDKKLRTCFSLIDGCQTIPEIVELMNEGDDKYFGWNFLNLLENGMTTIEFRRAPGVTNAEKCLAWVEFVVTFVQAAVQKGNGLSNNTGLAATVQELKGFLGTVIVSGGQPARFEAIFAGKSGAVFPRKVEMLGYSAADIEKLERMKTADKKKNLMREKMKRRDHPAPPGGL
jgi:hypothetical protein